ncbi:MAG: double zinc ribbon domain-containing protein [Candidatus Rokuibacteriota bacterium]
MPSLEHVPALDRPRASGAPWRRWAGALLDLVFPPFCPVCRVRLDEDRRDPLCGACWARMPRIGPPWCRCCGRAMGGFPLAAGPASPGAESAGPLCGACRRQPPAFAYARAAVRYEDVAREALHAFKFGGHRALATPLGDLLIEAVEGRLPAGLPDLLVPVPLHPRRERERGFNQSRLLARRVGRAWGCPVRDDVLVRAVATPSQTTLDGAARRANVRRVFRLRRPELVAGRHVLLVDDILTTGATVSECARCLGEAGPRTVGILTVARV